jgi:hypothetical protein
VLHDDGELLMTRLRSSLLSAALVLLALPAARAQVQDHAGLFKPETVARANKEIEQITERYGKGLVIVTADKVPDHRTDGVNLNDAGQRRAVFAAWARGEAERARLVREGREVPFEGVCAILCQQPPYVEVLVYPDETKSYFSDFHADYLFKVLAKAQPNTLGQPFFREAYNRTRGPRPDAALLEAVDYVRRKYEYNRPVDYTNWYWGMSAVLAILGAWLVVSIVRAKLRRAREAGAGLCGLDESGTSVAVLGGATGAVTGLWLFDVLFRRRPAEPAPATTEAAAAEQPDGEGPPPWGQAETFPYPPDLEPREEK